MRRFKQKRNIKRLLYSKLSLVLLIIVVVLLARGVWGIYQKFSVSSESKGAAQEELRELQDRKKNLEEELTKLQTEHGQEVEIREKFQVAKPGEEMIMIIDDGE